MVTPFRCTCVCRQTEGICRIPLSMLDMLSRATLCMQQSGRQGRRLSNETSLLVPIKQRKLCRKKKPFERLQLWHVLRKMVLSRVHSVSSMKSNEKRRRMKSHLPLARRDRGRSERTRGRQTMKGGSVMKSVDSFVRRMRGSAGAKPLA